jgi:multimeric flavodoxin WrbA
MVLPESAAPLVDLASLNIEYYSYSNANADDDFLPLIEQLVASPVWVIATPLYWYTMSAQTKTFLDRLSDLLSFRKSLGQQLRGKGLAVVCSGSDPAPPTSFSQPFELTCGYLGMRFLGCHYAQFDGERLANPDAALLAEKFGSSLKP